MRTASARAFCQFVLLLLFALASLHNQKRKRKDSILHQQSTPEPSRPADAQPYDAQIITPSTIVQADKASPSSAAPDKSDRDNFQNTEASETAAPTEATAQTAFTASNEMSAAGVQGVVSLDLVVAETVRAGKTLNYTYIYQNKGAAVATGVHV